MANKKSAVKRIRQNEKRRVRNSKVKTTIRTISKKLVLMLSQKSEVSNDEVVNLHKKYEKAIDTAATKKVIHWKNVARKKSRMAAKVNTLSK